MQISSFIAKGHRSRPVMLLRTGRSITFWKEQQFVSNGFQPLRSPAQDLRMFQLHLPICYLLVPYLNMAKAFSQRKFLFNIFLVLNLMQFVNFF